MNEPKFLLWDLPTRLFHWLLVCCVAAAILSGEIGGDLMDWHGRFGLSILGLLTFRTCWGLWGSSYARFAQFVPTRASLKAYLDRDWNKPGHNPLGAVSVFALLSVLVLQVSTGLFSHDDIAFRGPWFNSVSPFISGILGELHEALAGLLIGLVVLHIAAIAFYVRVRKENLVQPMVTGWKTGNPHHSAQGGGWLRCLISILIALGVVYGASGEWRDAPPPSSSVSTPAW